MADLQRLALQRGIRLPPRFALVGKTLAQADSIARILDPALDPVDLIREEAGELLLHEAEHRLQPAELLATAYTQLDALAGLPRLIERTAERLEAGQVRIGISPVGLGDVEHVLRSAANRIGAAMIVVGLLVSSALMAFVNHVVAVVGFSLSGRSRSTSPGVSSGGRASSETRRGRGDG